MKLLQKREYKTKIKRNQLRRKLLQQTTSNQTTQMRPQQAYAKMIRTVVNQMKKRQQHLPIIGDLTTVDLTLGIHQE